MVTGVTNLHGGWCKTIDKINRNHSKNHTILLPLYDEFLIGFPSLSIIDSSSLSLLMTSDHSVVNSVGLPAVFLGSQPVQPSKLQWARIEKGFTKFREGTYRLSDSHQDKILWDVWWKEQGTENFHKELEKNDELFQWFFGPLEGVDI